jgi:hypothetical protein
MKYRLFLLQTRGATTLTVADTKSTAYLEMCKKNDKNDDNFVSLPYQIER